MRFETFKKTFGIDKLELYKSKTGSNRNVGSFHHPQFGEIKFMTTVEFDATKEKMIYPTIMTDDNGVEETIYFISNKIRREADMVL